MSVEPNQRPKWEIDRILERLIGQNVRVEAKAFAPTRWNGEIMPPLLAVRDLVLPDNSRPDGLPVFFEGRLQQFQRNVGVVMVYLDASGPPDSANEGPLLFRGSTAVLLRGPAAVQLAYPFHVERLPADDDNYWRDLRLPRAQFEFPFASAPRDKNTGKPDEGVISAGCEDPPGKPA